MPTSEWRYVYLFHDVFVFSDCMSFRNRCLLFTSVVWDCPISFSMRSESIQFRRSFLPATWLFRDSVMFYGCKWSSLSATALPTSAILPQLSFTHTYHLLPCLLPWFRCRNLPLAALCPPARAVASASPGCFQQRAQLCEWKALTQAPAPHSQAACGIWSRGAMLERTAAVWMRPGPPLCPPMPTSPHSLCLSIWLSVCQILACPLLSLSRSVSVCVSCSPFTFFFACIHSVMLHSPCWLVGPLCLSAIPLFSSLLFCLPPSFISCLLSPPPLPASHISSAPSQTAVSQLCLATGMDLGVCCSGHASGVLYVCMCVRVYILLFGCVSMRILFR